MISPILVATLAAVALIVIALLVAMPVWATVALVVAALVLLLFPGGVYRRGGRPW